MLARVLVVDDEEDLAQTLSLFLEHLGCAPVVCHRVQEAKRAMEGGRFGFAFIDQQIAAESGSELAEWLLRQQPGIGITLMSGLPLEPEDLPAALRSQVVFLQKPFRPADVAACVRKLAPGLSGACPDNPGI